jgi:hypothetical protein
VVWARCSELNAWHLGQGLLIATHTPRTTSDFVAQGERTKIFHDMCSAAGDDAVSEKSWAHNRQRFAAVVVMLLKHAFVITCQYACSNPAHYVRINKPDKTPGLEAYDGQ